MLDRRADYPSIEGPDNQELFPDPGLKGSGLEGFGSGPVPVRHAPK